MAKINLRINHMDELFELAVEREIRKLNRIIHKITNPMIPCEVCHRTWDSISPCALCNATRAMPNSLI